MRNTGTGPGPITPDGSPVALYDRLEIRDELDVIRAQVPPGASVLELGSGAGRVTRPLLQEGFRVTAVDESADMLERITGTRTICGRIEDLDLGEMFDAVLLMSFLIHTPSPERRQAMLRTCRRHVAASGVVLLQREGADWHTRVPVESPLDDGVGRVVSSEPAAPGVNLVTVEYDMPYGFWTQTFYSRPLTTEQFEAALADAGLAVDAYLTRDGVWVSAFPA